MMMNKLRLVLDDLRVDTFSTSGARNGEEGTVRGYNVTYGPSYDEPCIPDYTDGCPPYTQAYTCATCAYSCNGTCGYTCYTCWNTCAATCDPCYPIE
jgi:hypothetical protein